MATNLKNIWFCPKCKKDITSKIIEDAQDNSQSLPPISNVVCNHCEEYLTVRYTWEIMLSKAEIISEQE